MSSITIMIYAVWNKVISIINHK